MKIKGIVVFGIGDNVSGNIHQELRETNAANVMDTVVFWTPQIAAFLDAMADEFGEVFFVGECGNHDRNSMKPRFKGRMQDSFDWIIYHWLADHFKNDPRVTFQIPEAMDTRVNILGTKFLLTHGDCFFGGSGIAGMLSPLMLGLHRTNLREQGIERILKAEQLITDLNAGVFDHMVLGHFHQEWFGKGLIANGAFCGYNEYNFGRRHAPERPSQTLFIVSAKNGITMRMPIYPSDPVKEGWGRRKRRRSA